MGSAACAGRARPIHITQCPDLHVIVEERMDIPCAGVTVVLLWRCSPRIPSLPRREGTLLRYIGSHAEQLQFRITVTFQDMNAWPATFNVPFQYVALWDALQRTGSPHIGAIQHTGYRGLCILATAQLLVIGFLPQPLLPHVRITL